MKGKVVAIVDPKGIIVNYHIAYTKEVLVQVLHLNGKRKARQLVGQKAVWKDKKGNAYKGVVTGVHGKGTTLKVKFKKPLPAKALAKIISIGE